MVPQLPFQKILHLLNKSHKPSVKVATSTISGGGDGVFVAEKDVDPALPLCLYPGVYTPGLPLHVVSDDAASVYLANKTLPPSGIMFEHNAYIFNLSQLGGYIDGEALHHRSPINPSACAHKINHNARGANARVVPFYWSHVLREKEVHKGEFYDIPNALRNDNSPWYFDGERVYCFNNSDTEHQPLCGAVVFTTQPLEAGSELLLDYALKLPLPPWAREWHA